jgi:glycine C-acetyltransferase
MSELGFDVLPGEHPIIPVMLGDAVVAGKLADRLMDKRVYVTAFSHPVVPHGRARIRTQMSAAHTREDLERATAAFAAARAELDLSVGRPS